MVNNRICTCLILISEYENHIIKRIMSIKYLRMLVFRAHWLNYAVLRLYKWTLIVLQGMKI